MKKAFFRIFLAMAPVLLAAMFVSCENETSSALFNLSGTLTKSGIADGTFAYSKLVAQGGAPTEAALYWVRSSAFSSGTATYNIGDIPQGTYTQYTFIDVDGNAVGDGTSLPSTGDWVAGGNDVTMDTDKTVDVVEVEWTQI